MEYWIGRINQTDLVDKKVYIFGGTGPVGTCTAVLLSDCDADVYLVSHRGEHVANEIADECNARFNTNVRGESNLSEQETTELSRMRMMRCILSIQRLFGWRGK